MWINWFIRLRFGSEIVIVFLLVDWEETLLNKNVDRVYGNKISALFLPYFLVSREENTIFFSPRIRKSTHFVFFILYSTF